MAGHSSSIPEGRAPGCLLHVQMNIMDAGMGEGWEEVEASECLMDAEPVYIVA